MLRCNRQPLPWGKLFCCIKKDWLRGGQQEGEAQSWLMQKRWAETLGSQAIFITLCPAYSGFTACSLGVSGIGGQKNMSCISTQKHSTRPPYLTDETSIKEWVPWQPASLSLPRKMQVDPRLASPAWVPFTTGTYMKSRTPCLTYTLTLNCMLKWSSRATYSFKSGQPLPN